METRPFKTYEEQIEILKNQHNIKIGDINFAIKALSTVSYYDLINGYKDCFSKNDKFEDMSLEYLYTFHHFDHSIQNALFQYTVYAEKFFKTSLSYVLAKNYGIDTKSYLKKANFKIPNNSHEKKLLSKTLTNIHNVYKKDIRFIDNPTKHYIQTKSHIPPWILFKNVTFSDSIELYAFMKSKDKDEICEYMLPNISPPYRKELLKCILTVIRKYRNKIAHNLKFISYKTKKKLINYNYLKNTKYQILVDSIKKIQYDNIYSFIIALIIILNDKYLVKELSINISFVIGKFIDIPEERELYLKYFEIAEIPEDIFDRLNTFLSKL